MTSKEIVDAVTSYVRDENAKYAILIDGAWGSGKTYLYENYLADAIDSIEVGKNERKHNVYISLYGISSIDSLAKQLIVVDFLNLHNADLLACLWNDLYTVISLQKEKGPRAPYLESCVL